MYWLVDERIISWTEAKNMTILEVDQLAHFHEAALAAEWRNHEKASRK